MKTKNEIQTKLEDVKVKLAKESKDKVEAEQTVRQREVEIMRKDKELGEQKEDILKLKIQLENIG